MDNTLLENSVRFEADGVEGTLGFQKLVNVRRSERRVATKIKPDPPFLVAVHHRLQNGAPAVGAMNIAWAKGTPLQITELVEQEKRMIAGAVRVTIVRCSLLFAMGRADAAVHVEDDHLRWAAVMNLVDPRPAHVGQDFNVRIGRQKLRLEAPHLAGGSGLPFDSLAADNSPHGRITSETVGVIYVFITAKTTKHRLTKLARHTVPSVLAGTAVLENIPGNFSQAKGIIKLPKSEQPSVGSDLGAVKFQLQAAVEINPQRGLSAFTRRVT